MKNSKILIGVLGGVAVGALVGLLCAPDKGSNTRKKITQKSNKVTEDLKQQLENVTNSIVEKYNSLVSKSGEYMENNKTNI